MSDPTTPPPIKVSSLPLITALDLDLDSFLVEHVGGDGVPRTSRILAKDASIGGSSGSPTGGGGGGGTGDGGDLTTTIMGLNALLNNAVAQLSADSAQAEANYFSILTQANLARAQVIGDVAALQNQSAVDFAHLLSDFYALVGDTTGQNLALILNEQTLRLTSDESFAQTLSGLITTFNTGLTSATALIANEETTRTTVDSALAQSVVGLDAKITTATGTLEAIIFSESTATVSLLQAQAQNITSLSADIGNTTALINGEQLARSTFDMALAETINALNATFTANGQAIAALIANEQTATVSADEAQAQIISVLQATFGSGLASAFAAITDEETARATAFGSLTQVLTALQASYFLSSAAIATEQTINLTFDSALAQTVSGLNANLNLGFGALSSLIVNQQTANINSNQALVQNLLTLTASLASLNSSVSASIQREDVAVANANLASSSAITALSASIGANSAQIATLQTAVTDPNGSVAQALSRVEAQTNNPFFAQIMYEFVSTDQPALDGFTSPANVTTITQNGDTITVAPKASSPFSVYLQSPPFSAITGVNYDRVRMRIRRLSGSDWTGSLSWKNSVHGVNFTTSGYYSTIPDLLVGNNIWQTVEWDLSQISDWTSSSSITQLWFLLTYNTPTNGASFEIDWIALGKVSPGPLTAEVLVNAESITDLQGNASSTYGVYLDVNGHATGFVLNDGTLAGGNYTSSFTVTANTFTIQSSNPLTGSTLSGWQSPGTTTINGGQITALSVTVAQLAANSVTTIALAAGSITADKVSIGMGDSLCLNASFEQLDVNGNPVGWNLTGGAFAAHGVAIDGNICILTVSGTAGGVNATNVIPVNSKIPYYMTFHCLPQGSLTQAIVVGCYQYLADGVTFCPTPFKTIANNSATNLGFILSAWNVLSGQMLFDPTCCFVRPFLRCNNNSLAGAFGRLDGVYLSSTSPNEAITSLDGGKITTGSIQSNNYVSGSTGWKIGVTDGSAEFGSIIIRNAILYNAVAVPTFINDYTKIATTGQSYSSYDQLSCRAVAPNVPGAQYKIRFEATGSEVTSSSPFWPWYPGNHPDGHGGYLQGDGTGPSDFLGYNFSDGSGGADGGVLYQGSQTFRACCVAPPNYNVLGQEAAITFTWTPPDTNTLPILPAPFVYRLSTDGGTKGSTGYVVRADDLNTNAQLQKSADGVTGWVNYTNNAAVSISSGLNIYFKAILAGYRDSPITGFANTTSGVPQGGGGGIAGGGNRYLA